MKKINKKMKVSEIVSENPEAAEILFEEGMMCAGCPFASIETLEQGASGHGMDKKQIEKIVKKMNKK
jgi:hybrid cluster-associated redox disulfide protein